MQPATKLANLWRAHKIHAAVAAMVLLLHAGLIYALWMARTERLPALEPVFAELVADEPVAQPTSPTPTQRSARAASLKQVPRVPPKSAPRVPPTLVASAAPSADLPAQISTEILSSSAESQPTGDAHAQTTHALAPVAQVASGIALACPVRTAPTYPRSARRLGETGKVLLRIELDESGRLVASDVARSSGFARLDEAALAAVKTWRCEPALRDGQPLRIVSLESFEFALDN